MFYFENLIGNEYFPEEIPPAFTTDNLSKVAKGVLDKLKQSGYNTKKITSIPCRFNGYKTRNTRRRFAIPNPYFYSSAVYEIVNHSQDLFNVFSKSKYSLTCPIKGKPNKDQAYKKRSVTISDTKKALEISYQNNRYEIHLDINSCFDSIYTHSIPWALHGKKAAKKQRGNNLFGNIIDKHMRDMNDGQTNGILVGNAVSRIISEIILCSIDEAISNKFNGISCCRYVDDYYIYTENSSEILEIISFITSQLSQYELNLNSNKTQINESPFIYGKTWIEPIKQYLHLPPDVFLSKIIMEYIKTDDIAVLKYGLRVLSSFDFDNSNWNTMESRLLNLWVQFPVLSDRILISLINNKEHINKNNLKLAINSVINNSLDLNYDQELIWAIWFAKVFEINLNIDTQCKILSYSCDIASIILLDLIYSNTKENSPKIKKSLSQLLEVLIPSDLEEDQDIMWTSHWLLIYESGRNNWIDTKLKDAIQNNKFFKALLDKDIYFYDRNYEYEIKKVGSNHPSGFVTKKELNVKLSELKRIIEKLVNDNVDIENNNEVDIILKDVTDIIDNTSNIY